MVEGIFTILFGIGIISFSLPEMDDLYKLIGYKVKLWCYTFKSEQWETNRAEILEDKILEHIRRLLHATLAMGTRRSIRAFFILSGLLFFTVLFFVGIRTNYILAIGAAFSSAACPYLLLQYKLRRKRIVSSHEGEILITELLNNYKINFNNIQQAIEITATTIQEAPNSKRLLFYLAKGLNKAADHREIKMLLSAFRFEIGTSWAGILAADIELAYVYGIKIGESLADLAKSMREARKMDEHTKRENNEARLILKYLSPLCWGLTFIGGSYFFEMKLTEFLHYQFGTEVGVTWLVIWALLYLAANGAFILFSKRKLDL